MIATRAVLSAMAIAVANVSHAQQTSESVRVNHNSLARLAADSGSTSGNGELDFAQFMARVLATHPVVRQADENISAVRADRRAALGAFDPTLSVAFDRKAFGNTTYFEGSSAKLTVPTPLGADLSVSFERASGVYLNPERRTPSVGLLSAAVRIPIGQRLLTDERRTGLAVANAALDAAEAERESALNKLVAGAAKDYALWYESEQRDVIAQNAVALAEFRLSATRQRAAAGEAAAIDTVEAQLELRRRAVIVLEAQQAVRASRAVMATYWWSNTGRPQNFSETLAPSAMPDSTSVLLARNLLADAMPGAPAWQPYVSAHPDVRKARAKLDLQLATARLSRQGLLPNAYVEMGALTRADEAWPSVNAGSSKISAGLTQSLLLLRERGKAAAADARANVQYADVARVERDVEASILIAVTELQTIEQLLAMQRLAVGDARALQAAEQARFEAGESTLFLVNSRDRAVLDESLKLAALEAKRLSALVQFRVALGGGDRVP